MNISRKNGYIACLLMGLMVSQSINAAALSDDFVTTWKTDNPGSSNDSSILLPMVGGPYDADWDNDGTFDELGLNGSTTHVFAEAGIYTIRIRGSYDAIKFGLNTDALKIVEINQWGTNAWLSMENAFFGTTNMLVPAVDIPDFSALTSLHGMFSGARNANPDTSDWDTSTVTTMSNMFRNANVAIPDTTDWNTSNVEDMEGMFFSANLADPNVKNWDTAMVKNMAGMFNRAFAANPEVSTWVTSNVEYLYDMFEDATTANPDTSNWNTAKVLNMRGMFEGASSANPNVGGWNTGMVENMERMFQGATIANPDTSNWDTGRVKNMSNMFEGAIAANPDVRLWDTAMVTDMNSMFKGATAANPDTRIWHTSKVEDMNSMYSGATLFNRNLSTWDVGMLMDAQDMFEGVTLSGENYESLLISWNAQTLQAGVIFSGGNSQYCAASAIAARANLISADGWMITDGGWDIADGTKASCAAGEGDFVTTWKTNNTGMSGDASLRIPMLGGPYDVDWNNDGIFDQFNQSDSTEHFYGQEGTYTVRVRGSYDSIRFSNSSFGADKLKILAINQWGKNAWTSMNTSFDGAANMLVPASDTPDFSGVSDMRGMFRFATVANPDTSNWDTANVTDFREMFRNAEAANPDTSNWNTSKVTDMLLMFSRAASAIPDTTNWNTSNVILMWAMFSRATLANPDTSNWNTEKVTTMRSMFSEATSANPDVSNWDTSNVITMRRMFYQASSANPDVSAWDTAKLESTDSMFLGATSFDREIGSWNVSSLNDAQKMFDGVTLSTNNYDQLLTGWNAQVLLPVVTFSGGNSHYCSDSAIAAHANMTSADGWIISDGGEIQACPPATPLLAPDLTPESDDGASNSDNLTEDQQPDFFVECSAPSNTITLYIDVPAPRTVVGSLVCASDGTDVVSVSSALTPAIYQFNYSDENANGVSGDSPTLAVEIYTDLIFSDGFE